MCIAGYFRKFSFNEFISAVIFPLLYESPRLAAARLYTSTVGTMKIALSENIVLLLLPHVDIPTVCLLSNLSLDGELCLRDGKNAAFL